MFWTNRGCDTNRFGPNSVGLPTIYHVSITPNQRVGTDRQILDQSHSLFLKPKTETVSNRVFYWLITHPGVGFFLGFWGQTENQWLTQRPGCTDKGLVCCAEGTSKCLHPFSIVVICCVCVVCVFTTFFHFVLEVCWHLTTVFFLLHFFDVFLCCCFRRFCGSPAYLPHSYGDFVLAY